MQAVILSIGDELVLGQTVDTNSAFLSAQLVSLGIATLYHQTVADDRPLITSAIREASQAAELVLISGGIGPTEDDLTRDALADAMGVPLVLHAPSVEVIRGYFTRRGRDMPDRNKVQAMHPVGSEIIANSCGTAPGIRARLNRATIYVTPGVPGEMFVMWDKSILPEIRQLGGSRGVILTEKINTFGIGESTVAERLGDLMRRDRNPKVGTTVANGVVSVRVRSEFDEPLKAQRELEATLSQVEAKLGPIVYGRGEDGIQHSVIALLRGRALTLATAESCTGGLLGRFLTDVSGSSAAYLGGWITYANRMKQQQLGIPAEMLEQHGAVSQPVARAMAQGGLEKSGADVALAITGVAGPTGGTAEKPVGMVWVALAQRDADRNVQTDAMRFDLGSDRDIVRDRSAKAALQMLRFHLLGVDLAELTFGRRVDEALVTP